MKFKQSVSLRLASGVGFVVLRPVRSFRLSLSFVTKKGWILMGSGPLSGGELGNTPQTRFFWQEWMHEETGTVKYIEL